MSVKRGVTDIYMQAFNQIGVQIDPDYGILWVYQKPTPRPCFNPALITEVRSIQKLLETYNGHIPYRGQMVPIHYHVLDSHSPGIFSLGGDLHLFRDHVMRKDKEGLLRYAKACIDTIHAFVVGFRLPITTISLVRGDALGGGFEVAMANQVVIAERQVEMGFPEILFNIFPGMGGYHLLCQRLPAAQTERLMLSGEGLESGKPFVEDDRWHRQAVFYELWVRSFQDSDGDGIGDLAGLTSRLDYLAELARRSSSPSRR